MKCKEFLDGLDEFLKEVRSSDDAFERNMEKLKYDENTFCTWITMWIAWHELGHIVDCTSFYWQMEKEDG